MIKFSCPKCQKRYRVKPELAGKKAKCAGCSSTLIVPGQSEIRGNQASTPSTDKPDFEGLKNTAKVKAEKLTAEVTADERWQLEDETMCQVFGFTLFGYIFGYGRTICFMEVDEIHQLAAAQLTSLGIGAKYADGLMRTAFDEFNSPNDPLYSQLVGIGHSHFAADDFTEMVNSIFENTDQINSLM